MPHGHAPASPEVVFSAAIAVLSRGFPLSSAQLAALEGALADEPAREALLALARRGMRPAEIPAVEFPAEEGLLRFLAALTLFALRAVPEEEDMLRVPEHLASAHRLPFDVIPRLAAKFEPSLGTPDPEALGDHLQAFLRPDAAVEEIARWVGATLRPPQPPRRSIEGVPTSAFEHPLDRQAKEMVSGVAGFDDLTRLIFEQGFEKIFRLVNLSSCVRVGPQQFPDLYRIYQNCVRRSGVRPEPELYLKPGGINAHTSGVERPYIMLDAGAVGSLTRPELEFIIGHELGHIRCQHLLHQFMANYLPDMVQFIPMVGPLLGMGLAAALGEWKRKAELSCDRMGLLICQDPEAALRVMIKWSGVPGSLYQRIDIAAFLRQYEEFRALDRDLMSMIYKGLFTLGKSHPWTVERAFELKRWYDEGGYEAAFAEGGPAMFAEPAEALPIAETAEAARETVIVQPAPPPTREEQLRDRLAVLADQLGKLGLDPAIAHTLAAPPEGLDVVIAGEQDRGKSALRDRLARTPIAVSVRWLELPGLNDPLASGEEAAAPAVLRADAVIVCLSALQLLSARERAWIKEALLPRASGRVAIAVCFWDAVEDPADQSALKGRMAAFLRQLGREDVPVFYMAGAEAELAAFLQETAEASRGSARAVALLHALDRVLAAMPGREASAAIVPSDVALALRQEHGHALREAEGHLAARLARLRLALPGRLAALSIEQIRSRGVAEVTAEVQRLGQEAGRVYVAALERALMTGAPGALREAAGGVGRSAGTHFVRGAGLAPRAAWAPAERPRDPVIMSLTAVGAGLLVFMPGLAMPVLGALSVGVAHESRRQLDGAFAARAREEAIASLDGWLAAVEEPLAAELREAAEAVRRSLEDRVVAMAAARPLEGVEGVRSLIREIQELLT